MGLRSDISVADVMLSNSSALPHASTHELMEIFLVIKNLVLPNVDYEDEFVWTPFEMGVFSFKIAMGTMETTQQQVQWLPAVWFSGNIPKHSYCLWFALRNELKTKCLLAERNNPVDARYVLCNGDAEDTVHLLINCPFSSPVWQDIAAKFGANAIRIGVSLTEFILQFLEYCDQSNKDNITLAKLCLPAFSHAIWKERFQGVSGSKQEVLGESLQQIKSRASFLNLNTSAEIAANWDLPPFYRSARRFLHQPMLLLIGIFSLKWDEWIYWSVVK